MKIRRSCSLTLVALVALVVLGGAASWAPDIPLADLQRKFADAASIYLEHRGTRAHFKDQGQGRPLVLVHGIGSSLHTWDDWVDELAADHRLLRLDLLGHGLTGPAADRDYRIERQIELIAALLDARGIKSATLAGNSLGGLVAWRFALAHPERVEALILLDAVGPAPKGQPSARESRTLDLGRVPLLRTLLTQCTPRFLVAQALRQVYGDPSRVDDALIDHHFALLRRAGNRQAMVDALNQPHSPSQFERLPEIEAPTLILWGELDRWIPLAVGQTLHSSIPNSKLIVYPGIGHLPMAEHPQQSARDVRAFLSAQPIRP